MNFMTDHSTLSGANLSAEASKKLGEIDFNVDIATQQELIAAVDLLSGEIQTVKQSESANHNELSARLLSAENEIVNNRTGLSNTQGDLINTRDTIINTFENLEVISSNQFSTIKEITEELVLLHNTLLDMRTNLNSLTFSSEQ